MCVCEGGVPTSAQIKDSIHEDRAAIWQGPHNPTPGGFTEEGPRLSLENLKDTAPKRGPWLAAAPTGVLTSDRLLLVCAFVLLPSPQRMVYAI